MLKGQTRGALALLLAIRGGGGPAPRIVSQMTVNISLMKCRDHCMFTWNDWYVPSLLTINSALFSDLAGLCCAIFLAAVHLHG